MSAEKPADDNVHLIVAEDQEVIVEHHPEDWIAFAIFWASPSSSSCSSSPAMC